MSRVRNALTKVGDAGQDFVGCFRPNEGFGPRVGGFDILADGLFQFARRAVHAPPDLFFGQGGKPAFHQIQPGGAGRREVHVKTGMAGPASDE